MASNSMYLEPTVVDFIETAHRRIQTQIPVPESMPMFERLEAVETRAMHGQLPVVWDRAENFQVYDPWGNCWIDFTSTIFVANAGHGNPKIREALLKTIQKPLLHSYTYLTEERLDYIEYLIKNTPKQFEKAFLLSAGTEATEVALKLMRLRGRKTSPTKLKVICFEGNWHGRTLGAQMMGFNPAQKDWVGYLDPNIHHLSFPYPWREESKDGEAFFHAKITEFMAQNNVDPKKDICGFMLETFQGWGAIFYPKSFVQALARFAKENDILLVFDEMQAGFARTGKLFGYMHYEVEPDMICLGKGASSGLPLSIVLGPADIMDLPDIGSMSSTHSANPLVCVAGKANLEYILDNGLAQQSERLGKIMHQKLNAIKNEFPNHVSDIFGIGLLAALVCNTPERKPLPQLCDKICTLALQRGLLLVHTGRESIKLAPPLTITEAALIEGVDVLHQAVRDAVALLT